MLDNPQAVRPRFRIVLVGMMMALTLASLDQNIVATALPRIVSDLGGLNHLSWVVTAFMLTSTATAPLYGKLSDIHGRKPAFVVSITLFLAGSMLCGLASGMTGLILFRGLQGLGAGGLMTLAQTTIGDLVSPRERGRYQGLFAAVFAVCSIAGPLLGGALTDTLSWRWIFYVNLPVGAAALGLLMFGLPARSVIRRHRIDYAGAILLTASTTCILLTLSWGGSVYPWVSPEVIGLAGLAVVLVGGLAVIEQRADEPIMPPHLFANRIFLISVITITLATTALFGMVVFMPLQFQLLNDATPSAAGLMLAPLLAGLIGASFTGGRLVSRTGRYKVFPVLGLATAATGYAAIAWATSASAQLWVTELILVAVGAGTGFVMPNLTTAIQNAVPRGDLGVATASASFFRALGGALGAALTGAILSTRVAALLPEGGGSGGHESLAKIAALPAAQHAMILSIYRYALSDSFLIGAVIAALGFAVILFLPEKKLAGRSGLGG
jgi:EmrB/QacA subfamily drug resistance transporter